MRCSFAIRRQEADDLLLAADVEVGERLVQQQQPGPARSGRARSGPAAARLPRAGRRGRRRKPARRRPRASRRPARAGAAKEAACRNGRRRAREPPGPAPARARPGRARCSGGHSRWTGCAAGADWPAKSTLPAEGASSPRITLNMVVLPAPFDPMRPVSSPACRLKPTSWRISRPDSQSDTPSSESTSSRPPTGAVARHKCSVETLSATAFSRARTSASIQVW